MSPRGPLSLSGSGERPPCYAWNAAPVVREGNSMKSIPHGTRTISVQIDRILESAVVLSWKDLLQPSQRGLIQIEYTPGTRLPFLKIWQLAGSGEWSLVAEYWMSRGATGTPADGMTFSNGYHSAGLAAMLEVIMQHQDHFVASLVRPWAGLIQVTPPTEQEHLAAGACMRHAYESLGLTFAHIPAAAIA